MKEALNVIKIGGNIIDDEAKLQAFLADFARLTGPRILVHGGGKIATEVARGLGIEARMVEGRRITDADMLRIAEEQPPADQRRPDAQSEEAKRCLA